MRNQEKDIIKAIDIILESSPEYDDTIIEKFIDNYINHEIVEDLFIYLPIVFCRVMLPNINFPSTFIERKDTIEVRKSYDSIEIYKSILRLVKNQIKNFSSEEILKIAGLSAEFNAINSLLLEQEEANIEDINLSEMIILR